MLVIAGEKGSPLVARHYSPYSSHQRRRARWPWVLLVIVLGAVAMLGGAIVSGRQSPSDLYDSAHDRIASITKNDSPSGNPTQPAVADDPAPGSNSVAQVTDGSAVASPQAAGSVDQSDPVAIARQYAA